jgi:hypothetical protein
MLTLVKINMVTNIKNKCIKSKGFGTRFQYQLHNMLQWCHKKLMPKEKKWQLQYDTQLMHEEIKVCEIRTFSGTAGCF